MSKADDSAQVQAWVESGHAIPLQANVRDGYVIYEFVGGSYNGAFLRLLPPFAQRLCLGDDTYMLGPPRNGRSQRLTYRLEG